MSEERTIESAAGVWIAVRGSRRGPPRSRKSRITGELETCAKLELNDEEYRAATAIMARYGNVDEYGEGLLDLPAAQIEVWGFDYHGCTMTLIGGLRGACDFVFELATAARLIILFESAAGDARALVTTAEVLAAARALDDAAHQELGPIILVADAPAMWRALVLPDAQPGELA